MKNGVLVATAVASLVAFTVPSEAQRRTIVGQDQDVVLLPAGASITIVRTVAGRITVSPHDGGRVLIVLLDEGPQPDGSVDRAYRFELEQSFPREYVWDGAGTLEEYERLGERRASALGLVLPQGRIFFPTTLAPAEHGVPVPDAIATFKSTARSWRQTRGPAAQVEAEMLSQAPGSGPRMDVGVIPPGMPSGGVRLTREADSADPPKP
jgi:hypothetical protein